MELGMSSVNDHFIICVGPIRNYFECDSPKELLIGPSAFIHFGNGEIFLKSSIALYHGPHVLDSPLTPDLCNVPDVDFFRFQILLSVLYPARN